MPSNRRGWITAQELEVKLESDPVWVAKRNERDRLHAERHARVMVEQAPILADLRAAAIPVATVSQLHNGPLRYLNSIPILLKHLVLPYSNVTIETIARSLALREAAYGWPILVEAYKNAPMGKGLKAPGDTEEFRLSAKDGLACALCATVTDATLDELIALVKDRSHGEYRGLLLPALVRSGNPKAWQTIEELADDPELPIEAAYRMKQKSKRGTARAKSQSEEPDSESDREEACSDDDA